MTPEQITHAREEMRKAITDPKHPWHKGARSLSDFVGLDAETLAFFQRLGPYLFEENGDILATDGSKVVHE